VLDRLMRSRDLSLGAQRSWNRPAVRRAQDIVVGRGKIERGTRGDLREDLACREPRCGAAHRRQGPSVAAAMGVPYLNEALVL